LKRKELFESQKQEKKSNDRLNLRDSSKFFVKD